MTNSTYVFDATGHVTIGEGDRVTFEHEHGTVRTVESPTRVVVDMDKGTTVHTIASLLTACGYNLPTAPSCLE
ncbi:MULTISPECIES: hypothetical protein [Mycolicibacterium]|uniref:hypothetical protein n=1 Tax=Mycolicibacterium TaxID=1866885 RepID=UPI00260704F9|nr:hypothetical protein [Mycolicibacterium fortuitum]